METYLKCLQTFSSLVAYGQTLEKHVQIMFLKDFPLSL
jgi:hypothetical protein